MVLQLQAIMTSSYLKEEVMMKQKDQIIENQKKLTMIA